MVIPAGSRKVTVSFNFIRERTVQDSLQEEIFEF
jgi:hypothetical protein